MDNNQATTRWSELDGIAVVSLANGKKVGMVVDFYFDPANSTIYALRVKTGMFGHKVLKVANINGIGQHAITMANEELISKESEDPKLSSLLLGHNLLSYKILSAGGNLVGSVGNALLDISVPTALRIVAFELSGGLRERLGGRYQTFGSTEVMRYGQDVLVVSDEVAKSLH
jgi:uncharacterized protein YrrD